MTTEAESIPRRRKHVGLLTTVRIVTVDAAVFDDGMSIAHAGQGGLVIVTEKAKFVPGSHQLSLGITRMHVVTRLTVATGNRTVDHRFLCLVLMTLVAERSPQGREHRALRPPVRSVTGGAVTGTNRRMGLFHPDRRVVMTLVAKG